MHNNKTLNFCQVSLARDIPIILQNYKSLKNFYKNIKINIICPKSELNIFKQNLNFDEFIFLCEDELISFEEFTNIFDQIDYDASFKIKMKERLRWYYQQILKISFLTSFVNKNNDNIVMWDSDTIMINKIKFFKDEHTIKYGTVFEFNKPYFQTNKSIIGDLPNYFICSTIQFVGLTVREFNFLKKKISPNYDENFFPSYFSSILFNNIFKVHKFYGESLFSEQDFIANSNMLLQNTKQKAIFVLRSGLTGQLTKNQFFLAKILNVYHVTYEHAHSNINSKGMLNRDQSWFLFVKILFKFYSRFFLKNIFHNFKFFLNKHFKLN